MTNPYNHHNVLIRNERRGRRYGPYCFGVFICLLCLPFNRSLTVAALSGAALNDADSSLPPDDPLANRDKAKHGDALKRFGGTRKTERAVADGLAWLAAHQRSDGVWDRRNFDQLCPAGDRCSQTALDRLDHDMDVGVSALAALAFLGAGHTHEEGPYAEHLSKVFSYILAQQDAGGSFAPNSGHQMYNDAVATIAIAEAYALTKDKVLRKPLERAVRHLERTQQPGGGWHYTADTREDRNDTSVFSWVVMALQSAMASGVTPALETRLRLLDHLDWATEPDGRVRHANKGRGTKTKNAHGPITYRYGPAMTAVGLFANGALGLRLDSPLAIRQTDRLLEDLPDLAQLRGGDPTGLHSAYYWYTGTLAMFNVGGEPWKVWNRALRRTVMEYQERPVTRKGRHRHVYGSWPAFGRNWGKWGRVGGRIYSTAINTLTLEIYYRYVPAYLSPEGLLGFGEIRAHLAGLPPKRHVEILNLARRLHPDLGEPVLVDLLESPNADTALDAALCLSEIGSPMGKTVLDRGRATSTGKMRQRIDRALRKINRRVKLQSYGEVTEINAKAGMLLFETGGRPLYYGQRVHIRRDRQDVGVAVVNRRFTAHDAAAARIVRSETPIRKGDKVAGE